MSQAGPAGPEATGLRRAVLELVTLDGPGRERDEVLDDGLAAELIRQTRPARTLAGRLGVPRPGGAAADLLGRMAEHHLTGDPDRWRGLHDALATSRQTLPDLIAAHPAPADGPAALPPKSVCDTLGLLLERTAPRHAAAALTALPDRTVETLLSGGALPGAELSAAVVRFGDSRARTALARHPRIDARVLKALVAADEPLVNAAVYRNARCTPSLRRTVIHALDRVPLDEGLRAELLSATGHASRSRAMPLLSSGDPQLASTAFAWGVRKVAQRYALLRVWERRGPDAVRAALADPDVVRHVHADIRTEVASALDAPDGQAVLRAAARAYEDPATLPHLLSTGRGTTTLRDLLNEPYAHDFRALAAANRQAPFMPKAAEELVRHEDATDTERADFRLTLLNAPWRAGGRIAGNLTQPSRRLAEETLDDAAADWAVGVVRAGLLDPAELVTTARPAARAVEAMGALAGHGLWGGEARDTLAARVRDRLDARPDAWTALLEALAEHPGTLAEAIDESARTTGDGAAARPLVDVGGAAAEEHVVDDAPAVAYEPPATSLEEPGCTELGALDLLASLAPGGTAPGLEDVTHRCEAPDREEALARFEGGGDRKSVV